MATLLSSDSGDPMDAAFAGMRHDMVTAVAAMAEELIPGHESATLSQPVLEALGHEQEEAAASLGASRFTTLRRVILPELLPALLTGFSLAFARALGEYGSVIFIAGNLPFKTEIAPLLITIRLEEYDYDGAVAIAALLLAASFACLLAINAIPLLFPHGRLSNGSRADG